MKKGFTLIEILVVLAIIGLFLSFILISLSGGRNRATENRYKTAIATALAQAENRASLNGGNYSYSCSDGLVRAPLDKVGLSSNCIESSSGVAFYAKLTNGKYLCVDSNGGDTISSSVPTTTTCPSQ
jgi:prepilin-type N-terminal cleavage/methylation domain-containing protein